jgi:deoxyribodipyrimidine photo-lyase
MPDMTKNSPIAILWYRHDLRVEDNPALRAAVSQKKQVVPVYIFNDAQSKWAPGSAGAWWLSGSLLRLDERLHAAGSRLIIRSGNPASVLEKLTAEVRAEHLYYNRRYDPPGIREQLSVERKLKHIAIESFNASLLFEPELIKNRSGEPFKVFTPFWKACLETTVPASPLPAPKRITPPGRWPASEPIGQPGLAADENEKDARNWEAHWRPGADAAKKMLQSFTRDRVQNYKSDRDRPDIGGTSRLSPHLHFGEISARHIWSLIEKSSAGRSDSANKTGADAYLRQLVWREFAHYLLYHFPFTADKPLRSEFAAFPWKYSGKSFTAWRRARTGYPIVDAGMRELEQSGWMHNRVRMIAASFLVKDLLIPWQRGAGWFWERLVDADLANNTLGWQWVAGCGADAAPFFRIFNPILQGKKFDPQGAYIRRWIPELERVPNEWIHNPWDAPAGTLAKAGVVLDKTYPSPMVDHFAAREKALEAYNAIKSKK